MVVPAGDMFRSFEAAELLSIYWILSTDFTTLKVFYVLCFFILLLLSMRETRHCCWLDSLDFVLSFPITLSKLPGVIYYLTKSYCNCFIDF